MCVFVYFVCARAVCVEEKIYKIKIHKHTPSHRVACRRTIRNPRRTPPPGFQSHTVGSQPVEKPSPSASSSSIAVLDSSHPNRSAFSAILFGLTLFG